MDLVNSRDSVEADRCSGGDPVCCVVMTMDARMIRDRCPPKKEKQKKDRLRRCRRREWL